MRAAVIDIGSSTVALTIGEKAGEEVKTLESLRNVIDLGKSTFYRGRISQDSINQLIKLIEKYQKIIKEYEVSEVKIIATTAVREARNRNLFLDTVFRKTGFMIEVLNIGDVVYYIDSFLSYKLKKAYPIHEKNLFIVELGSGNLDVSVMEKGYTLFNLGVPAGTLRLKQLKNRIDGSQRETYEAVNEYVETQMSVIKKVCPEVKIDDVILIDESYSFSLQKFLPSKRNNPSFFKLKATEAKKLCNIVTASNLDDLAHRYELPEDIADTIDSYAIVLNNLFKLIKNRTLYILETSLSEALLANMLLGIELSKKYNKTNQLVSVAKYLCRKYDANLKHIKGVVNLAEDLFKQLQDTLGLVDSDMLYLTLAAYLHNLGTFINNRAHHKHSEYIINALSLFRLTDQEIKTIACIARYHRKAVPQPSHYTYTSLPPEKQIIVQKLSAILRIAHALDISLKQKIKKMEIKFNRRHDISLIAYTQDSFTLEKTVFKDMKSLFEEITGNKIILTVKKIS